MERSRVFIDDKRGFRLPRPGRRAWIALGFVVAAVALLYYPVGMVLTNRIDDDLGFTAPAEMRPAGGSQAVAIAAALVNREVSVHLWVANDPFFYPSSALDNMPNFQQGIIDSLALLTIELRDRLGRVRGSSAADPDLQNAAGALNYSGTKWVFDFSTSILPTTTSEAQYRSAVRSLLAYQARLAAGTATFDARADNLQGYLDRVAIDLGSLSAAIDAQVRQSAGDIFDRRCDDLFYRVKGQAYGYLLVLAALHDDFAAVIAERNLTKAWAEMQASLAEIATLSPLIVWNGKLDGQLIPNHLVGQGFFLLRARTQLREIVGILEK